MHREYYFQFKFFAEKTLARNFWAEDRKSLRGIFACREEMNTRHPASKVFPFTGIHRFDGTKTTCLFNVHVNKIPPVRCVSCLEEFHESWLPGVSLFFYLRIRNRRDATILYSLGRGIFMRLNENRRYVQTIESNSQLFLRSWSAVEKGSRSEMKGSWQRRNGLVLPTWNSPILLLQDAIAASFLRSFVKSWNSAGIDDIFILFRSFFDVSFVEISAKGT